MIINNRTVRALYLASAPCLAAIALTVSGCMKPIGGVDKAAEPEFIADGQIIKMYFTYGESHSPLKKKGVTDKGTALMEAKDYDSINLHVKTKRGNNGKKVRVDLYIDDDDRIKYELFGVVYGNKVVFERPINGYLLTESELTRPAATDTTDAPAETTAPTAHKEYGKLTDARDGKKYKTMEIGGRTWMAENLNYKPAAYNSWCYNDSDSYCARYGRLYDWKTAMAACPSGWHIPTDEEWDSLGLSAGGTLKIDSEYGDKHRNWIGAGTKLRAIDWQQACARDNKCGFEKAGYHGFSALPGGERDIDRFKYVGYIGNWWSATERDDDSAYYRRIHLHDMSDLKEYCVKKSDGYSVRCVMDDGRNASPDMSAAYRLKVNADSNRGTTSVNPHKRVYSAGDTVSISAVPGCGYVFVNWTGGNFANADSATTTVTMNASMAVAANFKRVLPPVVHGEFTDGRDGKTYKTVQICKYVWMAENLNYHTPRGSLCHGGDGTNCDKYGRLYNRETAMLACPPGWHLSSNDEWRDMADFAACWDADDNAAWGAKGGKKLKAKSGWNNGNGIDNFDFSALPGGSHKPGGYSYEVGEYGGWWAATSPTSRSAYYDSDDAMPQDIVSMHNYSDNMAWEGHTSNIKNGNFSVRCVGDEYLPIPAPDTILLAIIANPGGIVVGNTGKGRYLAGEVVRITAVPDRGYIFDKWTGPVENAAYANAYAVAYSDTTVTALFKKSDVPPPVYGALIDKRDGKTYKTVKIGKQTWMAENLNYQTENGSWCYMDSNSYCDKYGRLYNWKTAKKACPAGWHLPSLKEWTGLSRAVGGVRKKRYRLWGCWLPLFAKNYYWVWDGAGKALKSTSGWHRNGYGTDEYGFSALPGGNRYNSDRGFDATGYYGNWWTATGRRLRFAYRIDMRYSDMNDFENYGGDLIDDYYDRDNAYSVRCVEDAD